MENTEDGPEEKDVTSGEAEAPKKRPLLNRADIYSTWKQVPAQGAITYFIVWRVLCRDQEPFAYELLRVFDPEFSEITVELFSQMVEVNKIQPWKKP